MKTNRTILVDSTYKFTKYNIDLSKYERIYDYLDKGHDLNHINGVRNKAVELGRKYLPNDVDLLYIAATLHDIGLSVKRKKHSDIGAEMVLKDTYLKSVLGKGTVQKISGAIKAHGYSHGPAPNSTFEKIIFDSDKTAADPHYSLYRAIMYRLAKDPQMNLMDIITNAIQHLTSKYGNIIKENKLNFPESTKIIKHNVSTFQKWARLEPSEIYASFDDRYKTSMLSEMDVNQTYSLLPKLKKPGELFYWMGKNIRYGFALQKSDKPSTDFERYFDQYRLQTPEQLLKSKMGVCWDQAHFEEAWFEERGLRTMVVYIELGLEPMYPTHTFTLYEFNGQWYYFENSFNKVRQNSKIDTFKNVVTMVLDNMIEFEKTRNEKAEEYNKKDTFITIIKNKPPFGKGVEEYMDFCRSFPNIYSQLDQMKI